MDSYISLVKEIVGIKDIVLAGNSSKYKGWFTGGITNLALGTKDVYPGLLVQLSNPSPGASTASAGTNNAYFHACLISL